MTCTNRCAFLALISTALLLGACSNEPAAYESASSPTPTLDQPVNDQITDGAATYGETQGLVTIEDPTNDPAMLEPTTNPASAPVPLDETAPVGEPTDDTTQP